MMLPNFNISPNGPISEKFLSKKIKTFHEAVNHVHGLPYGRNLKPQMLTSVISEGQGTCTTKHACLKTLAEENEIHSVELHMCVFPMTEKNTPGIGKILNRYQLPYLLEAHIYLCYDGQRFDYTFPDSLEKKWETDILIETSIDVDQRSNYKLEYHQSMLKDWIKRDRIMYTFDQIWNIREECIRHLSIPL